MEASPVAEEEGDKNGSSNAVERDGTVQGVDPARPRSESRGLSPTPPKGVPEQQLQALTLDGLAQILEKRPAEATLRAESVSWFNPSGLAKRFDDYRIPRTWASLSELTDYPSHHSAPIPVPRPECSVLRDMPSLYASEM